jgi:hypothetical protein
MKKPYLMLALLLALAWQVQAQQKQEYLRNIIRYRWDIGSDLLWLVNKNSVLPSAFVRLNTERNGNLSAFRFRVGGDYTEHLHTYDTLQSTLTKTDLTLFLSLGKEWQEQFNQFQLFYGVDLFYHIVYKVLEFSQNKKGFFPRDRATSIGLSPFLGFRYFLHSRFSISTEAHLSIFYYEFAQKYFV